MNQLKTIRRIEAVAMPSMVIIYAIRRLFNADADLNNLLVDGRAKYHIPWHAFVANLANYSQWFRKDLATGDQHCR